ncbi:MAG TPA: DUF3147 family protein [Polyangia bacterium]|jgi:hypothetical protein|nr:DUF3147 family protein [Polyangia bacterium]
MRRVAFDLAGLRKGSWRDYVLRFVFGGSVSVAVTLIERHFGSGWGGLFLGFPAILPATLTLVEEHDGRNKAADDAAGATCGAVGLIGFGSCVWLATPHLGAPLSLALATLVWLALAIAAWCLSERAKLLR